MNVAFHMVDLLSKWLFM